jgi:DNA topoisomerase-1
VSDPVTSAEAAGLRYVSDETEPGIRQRRAGRGYTYTLPNGQPVRDPELLLHIRRLAIPPAWTDVWICRDPSGHIQATGRDAKGRKQYLYHPRWREVRDMDKYGRLAAFARALPRIREQVERDLRLHGVPRRKVLATVVRLLDETSLRVGNPEYRRQNRSFGLTTLLDRHARLQGDRLRFEFTGKGGKPVQVDVRDRRLARIVKQCQDIPGQELFQYIDDNGQRSPIKSEDVNAYIREISGGEFTAKDFRTWKGTLLAARFLRLCAPPSSSRAAKREITGAIRRVADHLNNTLAVCRSAYVHPVVVNAYLDGALQPEAGAPSPDIRREEDFVRGLLGEPG